MQWLATRSSRQMGQDEEPLIGDTASHHVFMEPESKEEQDVVQDRASRGPMTTKAKLSLILTWALWTVYLTMRLRFVVAEVSSGTPSWSVWAVFLAEVLLAAQEAFLAVNLILPLFLGCSRRSRPLPRLRRGHEPSVDVCVTCCNEPTGVIMNTVSAAAAQDYPFDKFRVFVLDDGGSHELQKEVEKKNVDPQRHPGPEILYFSRPEKSWYKSGNLQFGIKEAGRKHQSEYFASLDADMIAEPDWLRTMLPHIIGDEAVALVNPPQVSLSPSLPNALC